MQLSCNFFASLKKGDIHPLTRLSLEKSFKIDISNMRTPYDLRYFLFFSLENGSKTETPTKT